MKKHRLKLIQKILIENYITNQDIILEKLKKEGIEVTQATLSRDFKFLKVVRIFVPNVGYVYVLPQDIKRYELKSKLSANDFIGVLSIKFSKNIVVIHTLAGYATQICVIIDMAGISEIIGTVAGDDTIIMVINEDITQEEFKKIFLNNFPDLKDRI